MFVEQLNTAVAAFTNIDKVSLHTADPGNTGENDSGIPKQALTWSTPSGGWMKATCMFTNISGTFTHIGLWDGTTFIDGRSFNVTLPSPQNLGLLVEFRVEVKA